jgi:hypothetical protein
MLDYEKDHYRSGLFLYHFKFIECFLALKWSNNLEFWCEQVYNDLL